MAQAGIVVNVILGGALSAADTTARRRAGAGGIFAVALQCSAGKVRTRRLVRRGILAVLPASQPVFLVLFEPAYSAIMGHVIKALMGTPA